MNIDYTLNIIRIAKYIRSAIYKHTSNGDSLELLGESSRAF